MSLLHTLRNTPWMAKLALLWFALTLGVAVASPLVNPQDDLVICTSAGMVKVKLHADGSISTEPSSELTCPLCVVGGAAPPAFVSLQPAPLQALADVLPWPVAVHVATSTAAPPPSRGPPVFL
ncbi:MAG: DUF2946 family protein [Rhodoferax sp.]|uniref:DUF2946 family protein n=1 Tax=Rhodoferax sp. TaxID=50421 RepID=UPI001B672AF3|nr:DUF2946 family protein [Rhodoferax sp.]MBP9904035.1 DUF2946 family protein [Rhodoferax sp.]